jgi:predicted CXXCH cytochrome family protein
MSSWLAGVGTALALLVGAQGVGALPVAIGARSAPRARVGGGTGSSSAPQEGAACPLQRGEVDRERASSTSCVACHDGTLGPGIEFQMRADGQGMSHPVEVDYWSAYAKQPQLYTPPGALPPETPLVGGKVACTSCHDPRSPDKNHVAQTARLCESCHRL